MWYNYIVTKFLQIPEEKKEETMKSVTVLEFPDGFHFSVSYRDGGEYITETPCEGCPFNARDYCLVTKERAEEVIDKDWRHPSEHPKCPFYQAQQMIKNRNGKQDKFRLELSNN